jgi:hypothetical protein
MRRVTLGDVIWLARAAARLAPEGRAAAVEAWIDQTRAAAKYRRHFGLPHRAWGDGSLTSRALHEAPHSEVPLPSPDFLSALALVAARLAGVGHPRPSAVKCGATAGGMPHGGNQTQRHQGRPGLAAPL